MTWTIDMFSGVGDEVVQILLAVMGVAIGLFSIMTATKWGFKVIKWFFPNAY
jgi:hypothetical protein